MWASEFPNLTPTKVVSSLMLTHFGFSVFSLTSGLATTQGGTMEGFCVSSGSFPKCKDWILLALFLVPLPGFILCSYEERFEGRVLKELGMALSWRSKSSDFEGYIYNTHILGKGNSPEFKKSENKVWMSILHLLRALINEGSADSVTILGCWKIMTLVWLGHKTRTGTMPKPSQTCRGGTDTPSSALWSCGSRTCTRSNGLLPQPNVMAVPAPFHLPSHSHPSHSTKTIDLNSLYPSPPGLPPLTALHPPAEKIQETKGFSAGYILGWTSGVRNTGQFPQDVLMHPYGLKCSIMKWTAASQ